MLSDWAALHPCHDEVECLQLHTRNPDGREEMTVTAAHNNVSTDLVAEVPGNRGSTS